MQWRLPDNHDSTNPGEVSKSYKYFPTFNAVMIVNIQNNEKSK